MTEPLFPTGPSGHDGHAHARAERALRRALHRQAAAVDPGDPPRVGSLDRGGAEGRRWPAALGVAAAVAALAVTSVVLLRPDDAPPPVAAPSASPTATASEPSPSPSPSATAEPTESATGGPVVEPSSSPVATDDPTAGPSPTATTTDEPTCPLTEASVLLWGVVDQATAEGTGLRLVPERAMVPVGCAEDPLDPQVRVEAAVTALLSSPLPDPDHSNPWWWDGQTVGEAPLSVELGEQGATVDLPAAAFDGPVGTPAAGYALASLVRTVVSNGGTAPVTLLVDGREDGEVWGAYVLDQPLSPDGADLTGGWVLDPYEGQRVQAGTVTLSGTATAFEATVNWAVLDEAGATVAEGFTMAGSNGEYGPWSVPVELQPGTYTAVLRAENMAGEEERPGRWLWEDTKTFTVVP